MGHTQLTITPRDRFLRAAQKELAAFEQRERDFAKKDRQEKAVELHVSAEFGKQAADKLIDRKADGAAVRV